MGQSTSRGSPDAAPAPVERRSLRLRPASVMFGSRHERHSQYRRHSANILPQMVPTDSSHAHSTSQTPQRPRRHSRLARARTFTTTIPSIFTRHASSSSSQRPTDMSSSTPIGTTASAREDSTNTLLPEVQIPNIDLGFDSSSMEPPPVMQQERQRSDHRPHQSIADRIAALTPDQGFRSVTNPLRRRRSPVPGAEDHGVMLSQLLSVAAAATAATLMGVHPDAAIRDLRSSTSSVNGEDGTFEHFLHSLRNGRLGSPRSAEEATSSMSLNGEAAAGTPPSLDFFRMFRFGSSQTTATTARGISPELRRTESRRNDLSEASSQEHQEDASGEERMISILIVGIRSLSSENEASQDNTEAIPSFLDALNSFPTTINIGLSDRPLSDGVLRQSRNGLRLSQRRRASMGGLNLFSRDREPHRPSRSGSFVRPRSEVRLSMASQTPPGPFPPPTTPASPGLSAISSGSTTPSGRASTSSTTPYTTSRPESFAPYSTGTALEPTAEEPLGQARSARQRRLSEPDFMRFGSGSSRRNGMHLPNLDSEQSSPEGNRSWIIYVLGGSYPENHPILTTPSLFTDSPTYEDMLLLSSLLGPAKPPVANADDVAAAPGLYTIDVTDGNVVAAALNGTESLMIPSGERCLVCLCDYEMEEQVRRLVKCGHLFHRDCIDQWLTTGRNSCPLCRGQGVVEKASDPTSEPDPGTGSLLNTA